MVFAGEVIKHGEYKSVLGEGMPMYRNPFEKGKLIISFKITFPTDNWISEEQVGNTAISQGSDTQSNLLISTIILSKTLVKYTPKLTCADKVECLCQFMVSTFYHHAVLILC